MISLKEHTSSKYTPRTYYNGQTADVTLAIASDLSTPGELSTKKAAGDRYIGFEYDNKLSSDFVADRLILFLRQKNGKTINIAGNGIYTLNKHGVSQEEVNLFITKVIKKVNEEIKIERIYSGGQTGFDMAGAIAAAFLKIDATITFPKGFIQRDKEKIDSEHTKEEIKQQIINGVEKLKEKL